MNSRGKKDNMYFPHFRKNNRNVPILSKREINIISEGYVRDFMPQVLEHPQPLNIEGFIETYLDLQLDYPDRKIVHSFCYDDTLRRAYNNPVAYLSRVAPYYAVSSFDFTMDEKMDFKQILEATYDNRWSGAFMQANGRLVLPTVGWVRPNTYDICFAGLRDGGVFIISTLGVNNSTCYHDFLAGYKEMRQRFPNTQIISVGDRLEGMDTDICYVKYEESFGSWDRRHDWWQPKLYNWDMSIPKGV